MRDRTAPVPAAAIRAHITPAGAFAKPGTDGGACMCR